MPSPDPQRIIVPAPVDTGLPPEKRTSSRYWTTFEERALREHYPIGRANACLRHLPARTSHAIRQRAYVLGLCRVSRRPADAEFVG
jgi:hypothetical protein